MKIVIKDVRRFLPPSLAGWLARRARLARLAQLAVCLFVVAESYTLWS